MKRRDRLWLWASIAATAAALAFVVYSVAALLVSPETFERCMGEHGVMRLACWLV